MADNNRNKSSYASDENWDKNKGRYDENEGRENSWYNPNNMDLDRDGNVGHTGGFYGGTNYMGSSYKQNDAWRNMNQQNDQNDYPNYQNPNYGYGNRQDNTRHYQQDFRNTGNQYGARQDFNRDEDYRVRQNYNQQNQRRDERPYSNRQQVDQERQFNYGRVAGSGHIEDEERRGSDYGYPNRNRNWNDDQYTSRQNDYRRGRGERSWWDKAKDEVSSWFGNDEDDRRRSEHRMDNGGHRGKGPKEYRRSDDRILEDVCDRLYEDPYVDASDVEVKVENGEVTLNGTIDHRNARRRAEDIIEAVSGVTHVQNNLRVGQRMNTAMPNSQSTTANRQSDEERL